VGRPQARWNDYIEDIGWNRLALYPSKMMEEVRPWCVEASVESDRDAQS